MTEPNAAPQVSDQPATLSGSSVANRAETPAGAAPLPEPEGMIEAKRGFMDGIDWQHHLENDSKGVYVYPSVKAAQAGEICLAAGAGCGIVEVEIRLVQWAVEQDLSKEMNAAPQPSTAAPATASLIRTVPSNEGVGQGEVAGAAPLSEESVELTEQEQSVLKRALLKSSRVVGAAHLPEEPRIFYWQRSGMTNTDTLGGRYVRKDDYDALRARCEEWKNSAELERAARDENVSGWQRKYAEATERADKAEAEVALLKSSRVVGAATLPEDKVIERVLKNLNYHASHGMQQDRSIAGEAVTVICALRARCEELKAELSLLKAAVRDAVKIGWNVTHYEWREKHAAAIKMSEEKP